MKGFIEVHEVITGDRSLIGVGNVLCFADCHNEGTLIQSATSQIGVRETYEEVKALIAEAQGDRDYVFKDKLQEWMDYRMKSMCIPEYLVQFFVDLIDFIKKEGV